MKDLVCGRMRLVLEPETGGAIAALTCGGVALLRPVSDPRLRAQHGRAVAGYPLVPFANRVAWGRFAVAGRAHALDLNFGDHPHTIHGNGWMRAWQVVESGDAHALLALEHDGTPTGEWPFAYRAEQRFTLDGDGLSLTMRLENRDRVAWPAGIGLHPYVSRTPRTLLRFAADAVWTNGTDSLPTDEAAVPAALDFSVARPLGAELVDNCFSGWGGEALVSWPEHGLALRMTAGPPLDHLQVYTPVGEGFLGLEPVSNMPDAINRMDDVADQGMTMLAPGGALEAAMRFTVLAGDKPAA